MLGLCLRLEVILANVNFREGIVESVFFKNSFESLRGFSMSFSSLALYIRLEVSVWVACRSVFNCASLLLSLFRCHVCLLDFLMLKDYCGSVG